MKILAIDTATEACSATLHIDEQCFTDYQVAPQKHSQLLLPMVETLLKEAQLLASDLDGIVFGRGPGSFTGVRIATGMAQGLAMSCHLPAVAVSTLATLAQAAARDTKLQAEHCIAAIDARMGEVYLGLFSRDENNVMQLHQNEEVLSPEAAVVKIDAFLSSIDSISTEPASACAVGTGWHAYGALQALAEQHSQINATTILYPSAEFMAELAKASLLSGDTLTPEAIQPLYIRDKVTWKKLPGR